ncbi:NAD-dependent epimerase/dehydratase family protein [Polynucleobacter sp. MWH-S4W17]|uniref:NAD-dependent epimerase/dehydratase family protein n=1 Tax=Polynucleobacter sp. MWH-S4W17 TaxID=1855910 RepID=UPI001BFD8AB1|nr:NAD-dependent epimerase/dehydratase family protein [Polynucleobacter sp. MWH-S4W17]QWD81933.1 NAD-dependent epimerase/dehydratase family protein [Polynucleobacter sp. MWH-S4W17]
MKKTNKVSIIAGGAGFIGSNLVIRLLNQGHSVLVVDNFSLGRLENLKRSLNHPRLTVIDADLSSAVNAINSFGNATALGDDFDIWHLAANSDIPAGINNIDIDLNATFQTTVNILKAMKHFEMRNFYFASSSAIYGDMGDIAIREDSGPLLPISNYGAMKLASEALASASSESFLDLVRIFRFPNVVGAPATHGVIFDFINKLHLSGGKFLHVLGNGSQKKSYLHVSDLLSAMLTVRDSLIETRIQAVNIGPNDDGASVKWIAENVAARISPNAEIIYGEGNKGWVGDVPKFNYSVDLIKSYGWGPVLSSEDAIKRSIDEIAIQLGY